LNYLGTVLFGKLFNDAHNPLHLRGLYPLRRVRRVEMLALDKAFQHNYGDSLLNYSNGAECLPSKTNGSAGLEKTGTDHVF
jgi:hypothetical protein